MTRPEDYREYNITLKLYHASEGRPDGLTGAGAYAMLNQRQTKKAKTLIVHDDEDTVAEIYITCKSS